MDCDEVQWRKPGGEGGVEGGVAKPVADGRESHFGFWFYVFRVVGAVF